MKTQARERQQRVMAHMLPVHRKLGLTIQQHKQACAAIIELMGVELLVLVDDVFQELTLDNAAEKEQDR